MRNCRGSLIDAVPIAPAEEAPADPGRPKRILTIDDSKTMRDMLRFTLVDAGYDVLQAVDGQDGLDVLTRERVDVIITDINMPKLDGYGVIRHLRADAEYDNTPILVLSTESDQKTKDIGRDAGATGWLVKPFDPAQLVEIVKQVSPSKGGRRARLGVMASWDELEADVLRGDQMRARSDRRRPD